VSTIYKSLHRKLSRKDRENNGQKIKEQRTNNDLQNITQKTIEEGQRKQWSKDKGTKDKQLLTIVFSVLLR
jgi:hypothetical protein